MAHLSAEIVLPDVTARHQFGNFREPRNALGGRNPAIKTAFFFTNKARAKELSTAAVTLLSFMSYILQGLYCYKCDNNITAAQH